MLHLVTISWNCLFKEGTYDVQQNGTLLHTEEEEEDVLSAGPSRKKLHVENIRHF
jgi:hypothetical protein